MKNNSIDNTENLASDLNYYQDYRVPKSLKLERFVYETCLTSTISPGSAAIL